jgi:signal peptidase II
MALMCILLNTTVLAFLASIVGKFLAEEFLSERIPIIGSFAGLVLVENRGVAFGMEFPPVIQEVLIGLVLLLFLWLAYRERKRMLPAVGFGLILGGAFGNILDRFGDNLVTDFFQVGSFPVFNVADSCITIGAAILVLAEVFGRKRKNR